MELKFKVTNISWSEQNKNLQLSQVQEEDENGNFINHNYNNININVGVDEMYDTIVPGSIFTVTVTPD